MSGKRCQELFGSFDLSALSRFFAHHSGVGAERKYLLPSVRVVDLVADKCSLKNRSTGSSRCGERSTRHKDDSLRIRLGASRKSLCRRRLLLLAENGQRFF